MFWPNANLCDKKNEEQKQNYPSKQQQQQSLKDRGDRMRLVKNRT